MLVSSVGRRAALVEILRSSLDHLGLDGQVVGIDQSRMAPGLHIVDYGELVPPCTDPKFIPAVRDICARNNVRLVIPTNDLELRVYAETSDLFAAQGTRVAISRPEAIEICVDKQATWNWLDQCDLPRVRQESIEEMLDHPDDWEYPVIVKPRSGSSSIGVEVVASSCELRHRTFPPDRIVQAVAAGEELTVDVLVLDGVLISAVPRMRLEVRAGEVSKAVTVRDGSLLRLAQRVVEHLPGADGVLNFQVFRDPASGDLAIIELNPRFGGGYPLTWEAGALFPVWLIEHTLGLPSTASAEWVEGLVMLRFDGAVFVSAKDAGLR